MARKVSKKKRPKREEKQLKEREKIESKVFDKSVLLTLGELFNKKIIKSLDYPIARGKEADVFRATAGSACEDEFLAIKIYRIALSDFIKMRDYIFGDPRFSNVKKTKKDIIYAWTQKEFKNLKVCEESGVSAPKPIYFKKNVLVMEFLGENGIPDSTLKEIGSEAPEKDCERILTYIKKLYSHGLVHADISEFNILMHKDIPYLIDIGQGVLLHHPKAGEFLERDVNNVLRYFGKYGIEKNKEKIIRWIIK